MWDRFQDRRNVNGETPFEARTLQHSGLRGPNHGRCHRNATRITMRPTQVEFANPREWLIQLAQETDGYRRLVRESGGTGRAAYRIARARCSAATGNEPCLEDLKAAAALLATCLGSGGALPIKSLLPGAKTLPPPVSSLVPAAKSSLPPPAPSAARRVAAKSRPRTDRASL